MAANCGFIFDFLDFTRFEVYWGVDFSIVPKKMTMFC